MTLKNSRQPAGFTLLEVTIIVVILGLLAGIVAPQVIGILNKQQVGVAEVQLKSLADAVKAFRVDIGDYPSADQTLKILWTPPAEGEDGMENYRDGGYLDTPLGKDPWGSDYIYEPGEQDPETNKIMSFTIRSPGPNREDEQGEGDDIIYPKPEADEDAG